MVKKNKSVERVKKTPMVVQEKKNSKATNQNMNQQVVQVIFPSDVELRKVKKKKKGKSNNQKEKDKLLEELKQNLETYDRLQEQAQQLKIKIPSEIGLAVINRSELKTNADIENYIKDVTNKINLLQQLIQKQQQPNMFASSEGLPSRLGSGAFSFPTLPALMPQPQQMPVMPQPQPVQPAVQPVQPAAQPGVKPDLLRQRLENIAEEIRQKAAEDPSVSLPPSPATGSPTFPQFPIAPAVSPAQVPAAQGLNLVNYTLPIGGVSVKIAAPAGFDREYERYSMYSRAVERETLKNQISPGVYHIPLRETNRLLDSRDQELKSFNTWFSSLTPEQRAYLNDPNNINIHETISNMQTNLSTAVMPADLAKILFKESGIAFTEITQGNQQPLITKEIAARGANPFKNDAQNAEYNKYQSVYTDVLAKLQQINTEIDAATEPNKDQKLAEIGKKRNKLQSKLQNAYDVLQPIVQAGVLVEHQKTLKRFNDSREKIQNALPAGMSPLPIPVPQPVAPPAAGANPGLTQEESFSFDKVKKYVDETKAGKARQWTDALRIAVAKIWGDAKANEINNMQSRQGQTKPFRQRSEVQMLFDNNLPKKYKQ